MSTAGSLTLDSGRVSQKLRTRKALLQAARELLDAGHEVTVTRAAQAATISPATAYRYFSDPDTLVTEALLDLRFEPPADEFDGTSSVEERVLAVHRYLFAFTRQNEAAHRLFVAKSLQDSVRQTRSDPPRLRGARRIPLFAKALEPARRQIGEKKLRQLTNQLSAASGIEAYLALKDVCGLDDTEADRMAESTIHAILVAALLAETGAKL